MKRRADRRRGFRGDVGERMPPHQRAERGDAHHAPDEHREPGEGHVDEHDLHGRALLVVVGRDRRTDKARSRADRGRGRSHGSTPRGEREEAVGIGKIDQRHGILIISQRRCRNAARKRNCSIEVNRHSFQPMPQARRRRERADHEADQRQRAQDRERRAERRWPGDRGIASRRRRRSAPESSAAEPAPPAAARRGAASPPAPRRSGR